MYANVMHINYCKFLKIELCPRNVNGTPGIKRLICPKHSQGSEHYPVYTKHSSIVKMNIHLVHTHIHLGGAAL